MRIFNGYIFRAIIGMTLIILLLFLGLGGFIEFVTQLDNVGEGNYGIIHAAIYSLFKLPRFAVTMLPMAVLLGSLLGLGALAAHSELVVMRASGMSVLRMAASAMLCGLGVAVIGAVVAQYISPPMEQYARQYRAAKKYDQMAITDSRSAWVREGNNIFNVNRMPLERGFGGVTMFELDGQGGLARMAHADSASLDEGVWVLNGLEETVFLEDGSVNVNQEVQRPQRTLLDTELLGLTVIKPETLDGISLLRYVRYLKNNGLESRRYEVAFWSRIAQVFAIPVMAVLAVPFVLGGLRSTGTGARMMVGVVIGLAYFLISEGLGDSGQVYDLNPVLVAWLPTILLAVVTTAALARAR